MTTPLRQAYAATTWESPNAIVRLGRSWLGRVLRSVSLAACIPALVWPTPALVLLATVFSAAGREVHRVVLIDRRRHDEQRHLADLRGLRPVLDQLEDLGAQHHRTGRDREIAAHFERRRVDHLRDRHRLRSSRSRRAMKRGSSARRVDGGLEAAGCA